VACEGENHTLTRQEQNKQAKRQKPQRSRISEERRNKSNLTIRDQKISKLVQSTKQKKASAKQAK